MKKKIYIDFDGIINNYKSNKDKNNFFEPRFGAKEFLKELSRSYEIHIFSTRNYHEIEIWLDEYNMLHYIRHITNTKDPTYIYIDDMVIKFDGQYTKILEELENFK